MSQSIAWSMIPGFILTFASLLTVMTAPAVAAAMAKNKHPVYIVDRGPESSVTTSTLQTPENPAPESFRETRTAVTAQERMKVNTGNTKILGFQDFYPIPEPETAVQAEAEKVQDHKTLYWIGAAGTALAAGVAAWFIFSSEPETQSTAFIVP